MEVLDHIVVEKGWGREQWVVNSDLYCGKMLLMDPWKVMSYHYHRDKHETFTLIDGGFGYLEIGELWDPNDDGDEEKITASYNNTVRLPLVGGRSFVIPPLTPHRLVATSESILVLEVSTHHEDSDSYRLIKGD